MPLYSTKTKKNEDLFATYSTQDQKKTKTKKKLFNQDQKMTKSTLNLARICVSTQFFRFAELRNGIQLKKCEKNTATLKMEEKYGDRSLSCAIGWTAIFFYWTGFFWSRTGPAI